MKTTKSIRIITFVPKDKAAFFAQEFAPHIPLICGDYDSVCWWSEPKLEDGTEQFRPLDGKLQQVSSTRMEFSIPDDLAVSKRFIELLQTLHPWEQPVILKFDTEMLSYS